MATISMSIAERQNSPENLKLLAAQNRMYSDAKRVHFTRVLTAIGLELAAPFIVLVKPDWKDGVELAGAVATVISALILSGVETAGIQQAATVQEEFDTNLFRLPWNRTLVGSKVAPELIDTADRRFRRNRDKLRDWYADPGKTAYPRDVLLCQRANLAWGARLQRSYAQAFNTFTIGYVIFGLGIGIITQQSLLAYVVAIVVPALPALLEGIDTYRRHNESAESKERLQEHVTDLLEKRDSMPPADLVGECRRIQDSIFVLRSTRPLVPNWWYELRRKDHEAAMRAAVERLRDKGNDGQTT